MNEENWRCHFLSNILLTDLYIDGNNIHIHIYIYRERERASVNLWKYIMTENDEMTCVMLLKQCFIDCVENCEKEWGKFDMGRIENAA